MKRLLVPLLLVLCGLVLTASVDPDRVGPVSGLGTGMSVGPRGAAGGYPGKRLVPVGILGNMDNEWHYNTTEGNEDFFLWCLADSVIPYQEIARLSVKQMQPIMLDDTNAADQPERERYLGFVDSVRAYNPNFISLTYAFVFGFPWADSTSQTINGRLAAMCRRNEFEMRSTADLGNLEVKQIPSFSAYTLINFMAPGLADSLANFHAEYWARSSNGQDYTGLMLDYGSCDIYAWECGGDFGGGMDCDDVIDMDRDNVPYSADADEQAFMETFWGDFVIKLRARMVELHGNDRVVLILNGNAPFCDDVAAANLDGVYQEAIGESGKAGSNYWAPAQTANRASALGGALKARFNTGVLVEPLLFMDMGRSREGRDDADMSLALAMMVPGGIANGHTENPNNKRTHFGWQHVDWDFGRPLALATESGDTISRNYEHGYVRIAMDGAWPYPYIGVITDSAELDTVMRGGGWPRESGPAPQLEFDYAIYDSCGSSTIAYAALSATSVDSFLIEAQISLDSQASWSSTVSSPVKRGYRVIGLYIGFDAGGCDELNGTEYYIRYRTQDFTHGTALTDWSYIGPYTYEVGGPPPDTTPPSAPALYAIPTDHYEHHLTWSASAAGDFSHYRVYRGSALAPTVAATTLFKDNVAVPSFDFVFTPDFAGVVLDTLFNWQVTAVDLTGNESLKSSRRSEKPLDLVAPGSPTDLYAYGLGDGDVGLTWSAPEDTSDIVAYDVYRSSYADYDSMVLFDNVTSTFAAYAQDADSTYYFAVKAYDVAFNVSGFSNIAVAATTYLDPVIESFALNSIEAADDSTAFNVTATFNKSMTSKLFVWKGPDTAPTDSMAMAPGTGITAVSRVSPLTPWPVADADSTILVEWEAGAPPPDTGYRLDAQYNDGEWFTLQRPATLGPSAVDYTHTASDTIPPYRGKWMYRTYAVSGDAFSAVAVVDSAVYNDAIEVWAYLRAYDTETETYVWSSTGTAIDTMGWVSVPDTTPPDSTYFAAAVYDTSTTTDVVLVLAAQTDEPAKVRWQWKNSTDDTFWPPETATAPRWGSAAGDSSAFATFVTDTIHTTFSTAALATDSLIFRASFIDAAGNISDWIEPPQYHASWDSTVFVRAEPAGSYIEFVGYFSNSVAYDAAGFPGIADPGTPGSEADGDTLHYTADQDWFGMNFVTPDVVTVPSTAASWDVFFHNSYDMSGEAGGAVGLVWDFNVMGQLVAGDEIVDATLFVFQNSIESDVDDSLMVAGLDIADWAAWTSNGTQADASATYSEVSTTTAWGTAFSTITTRAGWAPITSIVCVGTTGDWRQADVTAHLQRWVNDEQPEGGILIFGYSSDGGGDMDLNGPNRSIDDYRPFIRATIRRPE